MSNKLRFNAEMGQNIINIPPNNVIESAVNAILVNSKFSNNSSIAGYVWNTDF